MAAGLEGPLQERGAELEPPEGPRDHVGQDLPGLGLCRGGAAPLVKCRGLGPKPGESESQMTDKLLGRFLLVKAEDLWLQQD